MNTPKNVIYKKEDFYLNWKIHLSSYNSILFCLWHTDTFSKICADHKKMMAEEILAHPFLEHMVGNISTNFQKN